MAYRGIIEDMRRIAAGQVPSRVPFFAISQEFDARHAGLTYEEYLASAEAMAGAQIRAVRDLDYDWALYQVHDGLEFEALGLKVAGSGNILPGIMSTLPISEEAVTSLRVPDFAACPKIAVFLEAIRRTKKEFGADVAVLGRVAAPFTSAVLLHGIAETMMALPDPDQARIIAKTAAFFERLQTAFAELQAECGADGVWFGDCCASSKFISLEMHRAFAFDANRRTIARLKRAGLFVIDEPADDRVEYMRLYAEEGIDAINVGIGIDMARAKIELRGRMGLLGNLDSVRYLMNGQPEEVEAEVRRIVEAGKPGGGYAFCTDSIPRDATLENMQAMRRAVRTWGRYAPPDPRPAPPQERLAVGGGARIRTGE